MRVPMIVKFPKLRAHSEQEPRATAPARRIPTGPAGGQAPHPWMRTAFLVVVAVASFISLLIVIALMYAITYWTSA